MSIDVLYEDDAYVVFDKPAGLLVVPTPKNETRTLLSVVNEGLEGERLFPCHRLDRDTSGVILFAKGKQNQDRMIKEFLLRKVFKRYVAFAYGHVNPSRGEIKSRILDLDARKHQRNAHPQWAILNYSVSEYRKHFSVVDVFPLTGRTNQIRIQFKDRGFPIVGDRKYAVVKRYSVRFPRAALHAAELKFRHPGLRREIRVTSEMPDDMRQFLNENN